MTVTTRTSPGQPSWGRSGDVDVLTVGGEVDVVAVPRLRALLSEVDPARCVVIDLTAVTFIDSSGLGALLSARKALPGAEQLTLVAHTPALLRLLRVTGLHTVFPVRPTLAEALEVTRPATP